VKQRLGVFIAALLLFSGTCVAQAPTAVVNGQVRDSSGAAIVGATVEVFNDATHVRSATETNDEGIYSVPNLSPGAYHIQVSKAGFKTVIHPDITLNVQDAKAIGFSLPVGSISDTVTVEGGTPLIETESAAVGTVVDRQFAENLPMNGRSFQTLIQLTPGVVLTPSTLRDSGQFSVNGQRTTSNYWVVDGVSANVGISPANPGNGAAGALPAFSVLGGTNSLVSVDALQEFRIQTSTYAPEFGRTPGAQISIVTRSGTNQFHGTLFDYFRNDVLDANDWFANFNKLPKPPERQNDFGGTLSGPMRRDRTFFFFSYEGLRLRLPRVSLTTVPDTVARQNAVAAMQPFLNVYPLPNGTDNPATGAAQFNGSFSNPASLDAYSLRIDHKLTEKLNLFGRYNYSPSKIIQRGGPGGNAALSSLFTSNINTQTTTAAITWMLSPAIADDLRFNYSRTRADSLDSLDNFGGAVPLTDLGLPSPYAAQNSFFVFGIFGALQNGIYQFGGKAGANLQRQINIVDNLSAQKGTHNLKVGVDFRRLSPVYDPLPFSPQVFFFSLPSAESGNGPITFVQSSQGSTLLFRNLGVFAQDSWRVLPRLTLTYGLRWDFDFAPSSLSGPNLLSVTGFNLSNLSNLALAPAGTPPFKTTYGNVAPRVGAAYQFSQNQDWATVLRAGFGVFYDLATAEAGNNITFSYPFGASASSFFVGTFPTSSAVPPPPAITAAQLAMGILYAFDPNLKLPYTLQWDVALEESLGKQQTLTASYIGSSGRRLIQSAFINAPNPSFRQAVLIGNTANSDYNALQLQLKRRLSHGLQALVSYTWSHSIDTGSAGSYDNLGNTAVPAVNPNANRGPSDFDVRNTLSTGLTYEIPAPKINSFTNAVLRGWSLQSAIQAFSAPPINVVDGRFSALFNGQTSVRPDLVPGIPLYLFGSQYPGGKAINNTPGAVAGGCPDGSQSIGPFCPPPTDQNTGAPLRQGNLGRNALRGFGTTQWDFAVHRGFAIRESLKLQFRAEMFNVLNHSNFGPPVPDINQPNFGLSRETLGQSLSGGNAGGGAFSPLYQIGGPRSIQLALKLTF